MKPIAKTSAFLKASFSKAGQLKIRPSYDPSLSTSEGIASDSSEYCFHKSNDRQTDDCLLTEGDTYILENEGTTQPVKHDLVVRRGKLVNLGIKSGQNPVALIVTVMPKGDKTGVSIHLSPTGKDLALPPHLTVLLLSSTGKILQAISSKEQDDCLQLKPFKGNPGVNFVVEIALEGVKVREAFQL